MMEFKLDKAKAVLKSCTTKKMKGKENGKHVLSNDVAIHVRVDERAEEAVDFLFPMFSTVEQAIAARDGEHHGLKLQSKAPDGDLKLVVFDGGGNKEVFSFDGIELKGQPTLLINALGDSHLVLRVDARMTKKDMGALVDYIDADVYVSAFLQQPELPLAKKDEEEETKVIAPAQSDIEGVSGDEVRQMREQKGLSQNDLVAAMNEAAGAEVTTKKSIGRYERGERQIPVDIADQALAVMREMPNAAEA